ncbi:hypothetical protein H0H93_009361 [Arthromyces matolae]|nr:hypothetical protein H0H93_009361 [Arthromyces matolae]
MVLQCRCAVLFLLAWVSLAAARVYKYEPPSVYQRSTTFHLRAGGKKIPIVDQGDYDYAHFSADIGTHLHVHVLPKVPINKLSLDATRFDYNNKPKLHKNKISWKVNDHKYFLLKVDGVRELIIAVDPPPTDAPLPSGPNIFNVAAAPYSADKLGTRVSTHAFNAAISAASGSQVENPIVYVPPGSYIISNLVLPSSTSLYIAPGALIRPTGNLSDWTLDWSDDNNGRRGTNWITTAHNSSNIRIFGGGTIDAVADVYHPLKFAHTIIAPVLTTNFTVEGLILRDSGNTALNMVRSIVGKVQHLKVFNTPNVTKSIDNAGIEVVEGQNITISDSIVTSTADSFTVKASKPAGPKVIMYPGDLQPAKNIEFVNCTAWSAANYGFKVGQGAVSELSNITFSQSTVYEAAVAMGIHKKWGSAAAFNIVFERMIVKGGSVTTSYLSGSFGSWFALLIENAGKGFGPMRDIVFRDIYLRHSTATGPLIQGASAADGDGDSSSSTPSATNGTTTDTTPSGMSGTTSNSPGGTFTPSGTTSSPPSNSTPSGTASNSPDGTSTPSGTTFNSIPSGTTFNSPGGTSNSTPSGTTSSPDGTASNSTAMGTISNVQFENIWLPGATRPAINISEFGLNSPMKFADNITVIDTSNFLSQAGISTN